MNNAVFARSLQHGRERRTGRTGFLTRVLLWALIIGGCSSNPDPKPLPSIDSFAVFASPTDTTDLHADSTSAKATKGALVGGASGGAAVGAALGAACGPFFFLCAPIGFIAGGIAGGVSKGISEGVKGLPTDIAQAVSANLQALDTAHDFGHELATSVVTLLGERAVSDGAAATVRIQIIKLQLSQHSADELSLLLRADMTVEWDRTAKHPKRQLNHYVCETPREKATDWLANDGIRFGEGVAECIDRVSRHMVRDLGS